MNISPMTLLLQTAGGLFLAAILYYFYRLYHFNYLLLWARSWGAFCVHLLSGLYLLSLMRFPMPHPLFRLLVSLICFFTGFIQINWLLLGTYELASGTQTPIDMKMYVVCRSRKSLIEVVPASVIADKGAELMDACGR